MIRHHLSDLESEGRITIGKRLGSGSTNMVNVVTIDGHQYAGKRVIMLMDEMMRGTFGAPTHPCEHCNTQPPFALQGPTVPLPSRH